MERLGRFSSPISSAHPIDEGHGYGSSSHHLIDGDWSSFPFRPTPSRLLFSVCLLGACSPVPGRGMRGLRHGLRRLACGLLACVLVYRFALSLPLVRSLLYALCRSCCSFLPGVLCGVFMGYSANYLVGVGVSQNMPLNGILWLLTGIFGDGVRCSFSSLPACFAVSLCRPHHRPLPPASVSASVFSCGFLSLSSPFLRRVGRGVLCLLASFVAALASLSRAPRLVSPCLLAFVDRPRPPPISCGRRPALRLASVRVSSSSRLPPLPVFRQAWTGSVSARSCLLAVVLACGFPSCGRRLVSAGWWRRGGLVAWRVVLAADVVFGLWCPCLYIQFGCLFGYYCWCRKGKRLRRDFRR